MSLLSNLQTFITSVGTTVKNVRTSISGVGTDDATAVATKLTTTAGDVVGGINEVKATVDGLNFATVIDDAQTVTNLTWSSTKIDAEVTLRIAGVVDSAPGALDTLNELAAALGDDANFAATTTNALALKANIADTLSVTQLGAGLDTFDFAAAWTTAIA